MWLLILSVVALFLGIAVLPIARNRSFVLAFLDGFVLLTVGGLVLFELLPDSLTKGGGWAFLAAIVGLLIPMVLERGFHGEEEGGKRNIGLMLLWGLGLMGLLGHVLVDGIALSVPGHHHSTGSGHQHLEMMAVGVILHRLPIGLLIGWVTIPRWGLTRAFQIAGVVAVVTVGGFFLGHHTVSGLSLKTLAIFQALISGSLLHIALGHGPETLQQRYPWERRWGAIGGLVGLGSIVVLYWSHVEQHSGDLGHAMMMVFWKLALESAPALLLAFVGGGLMHAFLKPMSMGWLHRGSRLTQSFKGMAFGLPLPICSCGVTPLYQSLVRSGAPGAAAMAFLIATPELGIDAILISVPLLGGKLTVIRLATAAIAAIAVAWFVSRWIPTPTPTTPESESEKTPVEPLSSRLKSGLKYGTTELVDHTMPWIFLGLVVAAMVSPFLPAQQLGQVSSWLQVPLMALIGLPVYVCASGTTPFVAVLLMKGLSPGAALAFLLTGPATNVTTFGILKGLHGRKVALLFGGAMLGVTCLLGWGVNFFFAPIAVPQTVTSHGHAHGSFLQLASLGLLALLIVGSLWRRGPRFLVSQILEANRHEPEPCEDDCCDHEHHDSDHEHKHENTESSCCGHEHHSVGESSETSESSGEGSEKHERHEHSHSHKGEEEGSCCESVEEEPSCCSSKK